MWTKKHDEFCLAQKLRPSTVKLLRWILRRSNSAKIDEIEIDLKLFNNWIAKSRGNGYDRKTLREAIQQLDECTDGLVVVTKDYSPWVKKLLVRPLAIVLERKAQNEGKTPKSNAGNPMFSEQSKQESIKQQQQIISKLDSLFTKVGIKFDYAALRRIWKLSGESMASITGSIELLLHRHSTQTKTIKNPQGFIIECLKYCWHERFNIFDEVKLPNFRTKTELAEFCRDIRERVRAKYGGKSAAESAYNRRVALGQV